MARVARPLLLALGFGLLSLAPAFAADYRDRNWTRGRQAERGPRVVGETCHGPYVETARFKEQICRKGVAGYAECHWMKREHAVYVPPHCDAKYTEEDSRPADRGAFPPYPHVPYPHVAGRR